MAQNETHVAASPEAVWDVLADPYAYPQWVVGSDRTLEADADWPLPESKFRVRLPLGDKDYTHSREAEPGTRIGLAAGGGPRGPFKATVLLPPGGDGTDVTLIGDPPGPLKSLTLFPPLHWAIAFRNTESLRRFKR